MHMLFQCCEKYGLEMNCNLPMKKCINITQFWVIQSRRRYEFEQMS